MAQLKPGFHDRGLEEMAQRETVSTENRFHPAVSLALPKLSPARAFSAASSDFSSLRRDKPRLQLVLNRGIRVKSLRVLWFQSAVIPNCGCLRGKWAKLSSGFCQAAG
jgi:hypothetical protein